MTIHGHGRRGGRTPTYDTWLSMRQRCWNPRHARYADYGGRGITIDPRWSAFRSGSRWASAAWRRGPPS